VGSVTSEDSIGSDFSAPETFIILSGSIGVGDSRLDAGHYNETATAIFDRIKTAGFDCISLGEACGTMWHPVQDQARSNFKRIYTTAEYGVPFVGPRNMFSLPLRPERFLSPKMKKLGDLKVPEGWIIVGRSGTLGNILYVNEYLSKTAISDDAIRLEPVKVTGGYLYAFLSSPTGQGIVARGGYGSTVDHLEPKHLAGIPIPRLGGTEETISDLIVEAYRLRDESQSLFDEADRLVHEVCGLSKFSEDDIEYVGSTPPFAFATTSHSLGVRFDASHHVPVARSAINKLMQGNFPLKALNETTANVTQPGRFKRVYVRAGDHGLPFFQPSYVPLFRPHQYRYISRRANSAIIKECRLQAGQILVTRSGTAARCCLVTEAFASWVGSDDLIRINAGSDWDEGFLIAFLMTPYARHQILGEVYGGVIDHVDVEHVEVVRCPFPPMPAQQEVGAVLRKAYEARDDANAKEDEALAIFEKTLTDGAPVPIE
jgi:type I restriction enzyme S subunit